MNSRFHPGEDEEDDNVSFDNPFEGPRSRENTVRKQAGIDQILPADGWQAILQFSFKQYAFPLVCWATMKDERGRTRVLGMVTVGKRVEYANALGNFQGYCPPGWTVEDYEAFNQTS